MKDGRWVELGYHPEYFTFTQRPRSLAAATFAPTISAIEPSKVTEGSQNVRVVLDGSGFMMTSLVRVNGVSVKTRFLGPRRLEFEMPASAIERACKRSGSRHLRQTRCGESLVAAGHK